MREVALMFKCLNIFIAFYMQKGRATKFRNFS